MDIDSILSEAESAIRDAADEQSLDAVRVRFLGKKGELTALLKGLGALDPEERPKAGGVEGSTGADHPAGGYAVFFGILGGHMGHNIDRIGGDQQDRLGCVFQYLRDDLAEHSRIARKQFHASFTRLLADSCRNHHYPGACEVRITAGFDLQRISKRHGMVKVILFGFCAGFIQVHKYNFAPHAAHNHRIRSGCTDHSGANDSNFHGSFLSNPNWL